MFLKSLIKDFIALIKSRGSGVSVLMYHSISDNDIAFTVNPSNFARQMEYLKKNNYQVISLGSLVEVLKKKESLPKKTVVLTFDDGYADFYSNAWPILKKYNFSAINFLASNYIGDEMNNSRNLPIKVLDWPQIIELKNSGLVEFGCHTKSHPKLDELSLDESRVEIENSKSILEDKLGSRSRFFAYPKGRYNDDTVKLVKEAGFEAAVTINPGLVGLNSDPLLLSRNSVMLNTTTTQFKSKI